MDLENLKIKKTSAVEMVCDKIKIALQNEVWKTGDRLPSESDLSSMFGVNRMTVRMAIHKLNALGILETKTGSGTFVVDFKFDNFINEVTEFYVQPELLDDVMEFRNLIEIKCAALAIERGTEEELEELKRLIGEYNNQLKIYYEAGSLDEYKKLAEQDIGIHQHIVKMSHNSLFLYSFSVAKEAIYQYMLMIIKQRLEHWKHNEVVIDIMKEAHMDLYESIRDKDLEKCKKIYMQLIDWHVNI